LFYNIKDFYFNNKGKKDFKEKLKEKFINEFINKDLKLSPDIHTLNI
jgi:hypothetical protein